MINNKKKICGIYKITNPSGHIYIGQSVNCLNRAISYKSAGAKKQPKLHNSILKHGWNSHKFEIIEECHYTLLNELEKKYATHYDVYGKNGLNVRECGGSRGCQSDETKKRISESNKKTYSRHELKEKMRNQNLGRKRTDETKQKQRESKLRLYANGYVSKTKNRKFSEEHKHNLSNSHKGKKQSKETIAKRVRNVKIAWAEKRERESKNFKIEFPT